MPYSSQDVFNKKEARLVVIDIDHPHSKDPDAFILSAVKEMLERRCNANRIYRNTLVFSAADNTRLQYIEETVKKYLSWQSIIQDKDEPLNLTPYQIQNRQSNNTTQHIKQ